MNLGVRTEAEWRLANKAAAGGWNARTPSPEQRASAGGTKARRGRPIVARCGAIFPPANGRGRVRIWKGKFAYAELITGLVRERGKQRCAQPVEGCLREEKLGTRWGKVKTGNEDFIYAQWSPLAPARRSQPPRVSEIGGKQARAAQGPRGTHSDVEILWRSIQRAVLGGAGRCWTVLDGAP